MYMHYATFVIQMLRGLFTLVEKFEIIFSHLLLTAFRLLKKNGFMLEVMRNTLFSLHCNFFI